MLPRIVCIALIALVLPWSLSCYAKVEICGRRAQIALGLVSHWWLKTDRIVAGMGTLNYEQTSRDGFNNLDEYKSPVFVIDHATERPDWCIEVFSADEECVNQELAIGRSLGLFTVKNNCQAFVRAVINSCRIIRNQTEYYEAYNMQLHPRQGYRLPPTDQERRRWVKYRD